MNGKSFIYGILVGSAIAGFSTLLSTPSSGERMRSKVKTTKEQIQSRLNELKEEAVGLKTQVSHAIVEGKSVVTSLSDDLKTSVELWQNSIKPHQESIQQNIALVEAELEKLEKSLAKKDD